MLISAFLIAAKALAFVLVLALAGRAALRLALGRRDEVVDPWLSVAAGGVLLYLILIAVGKPNLAAWIVCAVAAAGTVLALRSPRSRAEAPKTLWWEILLVALLAAVTLADPVFEWDPRSIWFFHAKVIFHEGLLAEPWRYLAHEVSWSQPAYPELVPALAGTAAWLFGFWNDYLPKLGLLVVTVPALVLGGRVFADWRGRALFWALAAVAVRKYLWVGYMDGPLALWSTVALLYLVAALAGAVPAARASAVVAVALSVCVGLKVEGWVIAAAFGAALAFGYLLQPRPARAPLRVYARPVAVVVVPYLAWRLFGQLAEMPSSWATFSFDYVLRAAARLADAGVVVDILREMFRTATVATIAVLIALLLALRHAGPAWRRACAVGVLIVVLYCLALFFVYLGTPMDLRVQLQTSVTRAMLAPRAWILALLAGGYMVWRGSWRPGSAR